MTRIAGQFYNDGDAAEKYMIENYFPSINLTFVKIPENHLEKSPDGWIVTKNHHQIALAEIKLITEKDFHLQRHKQFSAKHEKLHNNIRHDITNAKSQLQQISINIDLPRILYFVIDNSLINFRDVLIAIFGPNMIKINGAGKISFNGYRGFNKISKAAQDDKLRDGFLAGIMCCIPDTNKDKLWVIANKKPKIIPTELLNNVDEYFIYPNLQF